MASFYNSAILKTRISSKQYKFLCETFRLSLGSKKSKKYACDLLQKEKEAYILSCDKLCLYRRRSKPSV